MDNIELIYKNKAVLMDFSLAHFGQIIIPAKPENVCWMRFNIGDYSFYKSKKNYNAISISSGHISQFYNKDKVEIYNIEGITFKNNTREVMSLENVSGVFSLSLKPEIKKEDFYIKITESLQPKNGDYFITSISDGSTTKIYSKTPVLPESITKIYLGK